ncbi:MAG TPA: hypothetical protein VLN73_04605, partial [Alphaproteobacteria bacterium]|nr:hypothetical protein [Alphaproteobacteria bacterium]
DLHKLAAPLLETFDLVRIDRRYRTPRPLPRPQEEAYIVAGSFVKFLIETFGMGKFRELYAASPFTPGERVFGLKVRDYLKVTAPHEGWDDVTFGDVLSMATGIGDRYPQPSPNKMFIDGGNPNDRRYREAKAAEDKLKAILSYGNYPWGPGKVVRYISNQTFLLSAAMDSFLKSREGPKANIWTMLRDEVYRPIGIHYPFIWRTVETGGKPGIPLIAAGMILTLEDAAKIAMLLRDGGVHKGKQLLSKSKIDEALFRIPGLGLDRGTKSGCEAGRYHMSFYLDGSETIRPGCHARGVYASGWGGNQIVFTDNGVVALRFADAFQNSVTPLLRAADLVKPLR